MQVQPLSAASIFLGVFFVLAAVGRAQEGPGSGYLRAQATSPAIHPVKAAIAVATTPVRRAGHGYGRTYGHRYTRAPHGRPLPRTQRVWIPGHDGLVKRKLWIPGAFRQVWVPPVYTTHRDLWGHPIEVQSAPGYWRNVQEPGRYEWRTEGIWRPGHWEVRG